MHQLLVQKNRLVLVTCAQPRVNRRLEVLSQDCPSWVLKQIHASKELKFLTLSGLMNWNLGQILAAEVFLQTSFTCTGVRIYYAQSGILELNDAATGDPKNDGRDVKRGSWPLDILKALQVSSHPQTPSPDPLPWPLPQTFSPKTPSFSAIPPLLFELIPVSNTWCQTHRKIRIRYKEEK